MTQSPMRRRALAASLAAPLALVGTLGLRAKVAQAQSSPLHPTLLRRLQQPLGDASDRPKLLQQAEDALRLADASTAQMLFDRAAQIIHAADAELGTVRALMQAGYYRRALAFCAHTAGSHPDTPSGAAFYAWMLHLGGQTTFSLRILDAARERHPQDGTVALVHNMFRTHDSWPRESLLAPPARFAPYSPRSSSVPTNARVQGTGVLFNDGRTAIATDRDIGPHDQIWIRDALGLLAKARFDRRLDGLGLVLLTLPPDIPSPFASGFTLSTALHDPFPGSAALTIEYPRAADTTPAWPILRMGFLGRTSELGGVYALGIDVPEGPRGGPVFDLGGRLIGVTLIDSSGMNQVALGSALRRVAPTLIAGEPSLPKGAPLPLDEIYESAMGATLQIITSAV